MNNKHFQIYQEYFLQHTLIYIIKNINTDFYKIGITKNLNNRFRQLQLQSGCDLKIFDYYILDKQNISTAKQIEKKLHQKYNHCRIVGEWFDVETVIDDVLNDLIQLCES